MSDATNDTTVTEWTIVSDDGYITTPTGEGYCEQTALPFTRCGNNHFTHEAMRAGRHEILDALREARAELLRLCGPVCPHDGKRASEHSLCGCWGTFHLMFSSETMHPVGELRHPTVPEIEEFHQHEIKGQDGYEGFYCRPAPVGQCCSWHGPKCGKDAVYCCDRCPNGILAIIGTEKS